MAHPVEDDVHAGDVEERAAGVEREVEEDALGACGAVALPRPLLAAEVEDLLGRALAEERAVGPQGPDTLGAATLLGQVGPAQSFGKPPPTGSGISIPELLAVR